MVFNRKPGKKASSSKPEKKKFNAAAENCAAKKGSQGGRHEARRKDDGNNRSPTMRQVVLLRRGESLDSLTSKMKDGGPKVRSPKEKPVDDLTVSGSGNLDPELMEVAPKQICLSPPRYPDGYAGSAFSLSPSPRSLPLPSFFNKKQQNNGISKPVDDSATRDLRRLLRLD
jgi:hypothetical protein